MLFAVTVVSCGNEGDKRGPSIEILSPENGQVFEYGQTINLKIKVKDESGIRQMKYSVKAESDEGVKFFREATLNLYSYTTELEDNIPIEVPKKFKDSISFQNSNYRLELRAMDYKNNEGIREVEFSIKNPENNE